jgi:hypothetical protein
VQFSNGRFVGELQDFLLFPLPAFRRQRIKTLEVGQRRTPGGRIGFDRDVALFQRDVKGVTEKW